MIAFRSRVVLFLAAVLAAAPAAASPAPDGFDEAVAAILARSRVNPACVGIAVLDPATGEVLASHRGDSAILPASCLKVATTAAAMTALGADYDLTTRLLAVPPSRRPDPTAVAGDLWLVGRGDPGFSEHGPEGSTLAAMDAFAKQVAAKGVRTVAGDLVFDASWFDGPRVHRSWTDAGASARWYAAEVDALTANDGCVDVLVEPGSGPGDAGRVSCEPATSIVTLVNRVTTTASRREHGFGFRLAAEGNALEVYGQCWTKSSGAKSPAAIRDPALFCAEQVGRALARAGVRVAGVVRRAKDGEEPPEKAALLAEHRTPLRLACAVANTRSQNLWAETVLRVLGAARKGEGSFVAGAAAVREALAAAGPEVAATLRPVDGSGLSRDDSASAVAMARILAFAWRSPQRDAFFGGLAKPGEGTLDDRFREKRFEGRVFAKTGTLKGVSGLVGLAQSWDGRPRVFAVLGESVDVGRCRRLQDELVSTLVGSPPDTLRR